jgi:hypothetical protein
VWGLLLALAVVGGLVGAAATRPGRLAKREVRHLARLRRALATGRITIDMAEDGAVLARRDHLPDVEQEFKQYVFKLKTARETKHGA